MTNFDHHAVGGTAVIERMRTRGVLNSGDKIAYAYGLSIGEYRGQRRTSHSGSWTGFRTALLHFPEQPLGIVILGNFGRFNPSPMAYQIADLYLTDVPTTTEAQDDDEPGPEDVLSVDTATLDAYVGTYKLGPGWFVEITRDGDYLMTQATRLPWFPMVSKSQETFYVPAYNAGMTFHRNANGQATHFDYRNIKAKRVAAWSPSVDELHALEGRYYSEELATSYLVELRDGALVAKHRRHQAIELRPLAHNEFGGSLWLASGIEFVRDNAGNITAMLISNGRSLNNAFARVDY